MFLAPILRASYPSIAHPCWDHSGRTVVRNLMNTRINTVADVLQSIGACNIQEYRIAMMKSLHPGSLVRHSDITL